MESIHGKNQLMKTWWKSTYFFNIFVEKKKNPKQYTAKIQTYTQHPEVQISCSLDTGLVIGLAVLVGLSHTAQGTCSWFPWSAQTHHRDPNQQSVKENDNIEIFYNCEIYWIKQEYFLVFFNKSRFNSGSKQCRPLYCYT